MYTVVLNHNCIRNFCISIGYTIGPLSKLYKDNQVTIQRLLSDKITPQATPPDVLITPLHKKHPQKTFYVVDTRSNIQVFV